MDTHADVDGADRPASKTTRRPRILYVSYTNPAVYPPLEHSSRILADAGWDVLFVGTGANGEADRLRFPSHPGIRVKQMKFCAPGLRQKLHFLQYSLWVFQQTLAWRPDWIYISQETSTPGAWLASWVPGVRLIYHEHDSGNVPGGPVGRSIAMLRRRVLRSVQIGRASCRERV